jgi:hypothetical protein
VSGNGASVAVIYGPNSSAKQKSIDDQQAENRAAAAAGGWTVVAELDDPSSASRYATRVRKNWTRLLELLPEVDVVVPWKPVAWRPDAGDVGRVPRRLPRTPCADPRGHPQPHV